VALSPVLDEATKAEFRIWGPGKYDPRHHYFNGTSIVGLPMNSPSLPVVIPSIYGLKGVGFETFTADGPISYWNSYVGVGQMGGHGNFSDSRVGIFISQSPDLVTPKLPALLDYQLSLKAPKAPKGSFDRAAAARGRNLFRDEAGCASCHQGSTFTDVLSGPDRRVPFLHHPSEVGMDPAYAAKSATGQYRTTPLPPGPPPPGPVRRRCVLAIRRSVDCQVSIDCKVRWRRGDAVVWKALPRFGCE